jgi:hypothetical protein
MTVSVETCCEQHDTAYGPDGTLTRAQADAQLYECLACDRPTFAWAAWVMVRLFGWWFWKRE